MGNRCCLIAAKDNGPFNTAANSAGLASKYNAQFKEQTMSAKDNGCVLQKLELKGLQMQKDEGMLLDIR